MSPRELTAARPDENLNRPETPNRARVSTHRRARASVAVLRTMEAMRSTLTARPARRWTRARAFDPDAVPLKGSNRPLKKVDARDLPPLPPLPDLRELAKMASMDISDEEVEAWTPKVHEIVQWFGALREIDLSDAEKYTAPGTKGLMADDWLRDDEPQPFEKVDEMMRASQFWDGKFIKVPAVGGSAGTDFGDESGAEAPANVDTAAGATPTEELLGMELKVGKVLSVENHPESDKLYVETVECGEDEPRLICSGLAPYMSKEDILGKLVVVVANLKPRNMAGVKSNGMLLAASDDARENIELLCAPEGAVPGERITWNGAENIEPHGVNKVAKKKIWEGVQKELKTDGGKGANWNGVPMLTSAGQCSCASLTNANVG